MERIEGKVHNLQIPRTELWNKVTLIKPTSNTNYKSVVLFEILVRRPYCHCVYARASYRLLILFSAVRRPKMICVRIDTYEMHSSTRSKDEKIFDSRRPWDNLWRESWDANFVRTRKPAIYTCNCVWGACWSIRAVADDCPLEDESFIVDLSVADLRNTNLRKPNNARIGTGVIRATATGTTVIHNINEGENYRISRNSKL